MPTGMGVIDPKLVKGGRKLKKTKHCTILSNLVRDKSKKKNASQIRERSYLLCVDDEKEKKIPQ